MVAEIWAYSIVAGGLKMSTQVELCILLVSPRFGECRSCKSNHIDLPVLRTTNSFHCVVAGFEVEEASTCVEIGRKLKYEATFLDYPINFYHLCCCITLWSVHARVHTDHKCS